MEKIVIKGISKKVLEELLSIGKPIEARDLSRKMGIEYEILMNQAVYELSQNELAKFTEEKLTELIPTEEFQKYLKDGFPERKLYELLRKHGDEYLLAEFQKDSGMDKRAFFIALGNLKKNRWAKESKATAQPTIFTYDKEGKKSPVEEIAEIFKNKDKVFAEELPKELVSQVPIMIKRKLIKKASYSVRMIELTNKGKSIKLSQIKVYDNQAVKITPEMLKDGSWKEIIDNIKPFEVQNYGPRISAGKLHPLTVLINRIREIFLSMGFVEIKGPILELAFYNFDSLYQPQDHPAREMHDTFYISNPAKGKLPAKKWVENIKKTHENGGDSGSTGWGYKWNEEIAKKTLLRTHTTATTIRRLSKVIQNKDKLPLKVFSIDRVFRNESVDRTHLAEFMQVEGIIIGENVNLSQLRGVLTEFYTKMGFPKIITRPGFFPYTEPSMEISVYSERLKKWLELGGSGIFRPEVCSPWGIKEPMRVLAWGQGFERLAMLRYKRDDIRDLYRSPLSWLRDVEYAREV